MVISGQRMFPFIAVENPQIEAWREGRQLPPITINIGLASQQSVQEGFWSPSPFTPCLYHKPLAEKVHEDE